MAKAEKNSIHDLVCGGLTPEGLTREGPLKGSFGCVWGFMKVFFGLCDVSIRAL